MRFFDWLLSLKPAPETGGVARRHLEFQNLPTGASAVAAVLGLLLVLAAIVWLYRRDSRPLSIGQRLLMAGLRGGVLLMLVAVLLEMVVVVDVRESLPARLLVLVDQSQSMTLPDSYADKSAAGQLATAIGLNVPKGKTAADELAGQSRWSLAQRALAKALPELAADRLVSYYSFAGNLDSLPSEHPFDGLTPRGTTTAIGSALTEAMTKHRGEPLAGVLVVSDGRSNAGEDPLSAARQAAAEGLPVVTLLAGSAQGPRNLRLADIETSPAVFLGDPVEIGVLVESRGLADQEATIELETREFGGAWKDRGREEVRLGADGALKRVIFRLSPETVGPLELRASVKAGGPEIDPNDNVATATVRVMRQTIRVLLVAGSPAPEVQFLRNGLMRDTRIELATWLQDAAPGYEQPGNKPIRRLPSTQQELEYYDVLLLVDPEMKTLSGWGERITHFVGEAGGGLVYVAGELNAPRLFRSQAEPDAPAIDNAWLKVLPISMDRGLYQSAAEARLSARETWTLELTPAGAADRIFQFSPEASANRDILASLPGMYWHFPVTRAKPGALVLAQHGDPRMRNSFGRHVLLATHLYGPGRTVFVGFDSTYRWRYLDEDYFDGFWARLIDRVGRSKVLGGRYPFTLASDKAAYRLGDRVTVRARLIDTTTPLAGPLRGELTWGTDKTQPIELEPAADDPNTLQATFTVTDSGNYTARFTPTGEGEVDDAPRPATLTFRVEPPRQEVDNPTWDRTTAEQIARLTDGAVITLDRVEALPSAFKIHHVERMLEYRDEIWDAPLAGLLVVLLLTIEWVLRKRHRMA